VKNIYKTKLVAALKEARVEASDGLNVVMIKLKKNNADKEVKSFFKRNWQTERNLYPQIINFDDFDGDPGMNYGIEIDHPQEGKLRMIDDWAFKTCPRCRGRLFPEYKFCPFCGQDKDMPDNINPFRLGRGLGPGGGRKDGSGLRKGGTGLGPGLGPGLGRRRGFGPGMGGMPNRFRGSISDTNVVVEDDEVKVTNKDVANVEKDIDNYIPG